MTAIKEIQQEITPINKEDLFIILNHQNAKFDYPIHSHPEYEINLVMGTDGTRMVGDSEEDFGELDLVMTGPYVPHVWKSEKFSNHVITIQFSGDLQDFPMMNKRLFTHIRRLLEESAFGLCFQGVNVESIKNEIIALTSKHGFQTALSFLNILDMMANTEHRKLVSDEFDPDTIVRHSKSRRIAMVCRYIEENISGEITLSEVANLVNMSDSAFSHFFKRRTNMSFITYVTNLRIAKACNLLASTTLSSLEICYDCGFNNKSNFNRMFTKKKGMTPLEYRRHITQLLIKY